MVQWLRLCASTAGGTALIPGRGTKIPQAMQGSQKKKKKKTRKKEKTQIILLDRRISNATLQSVEHTGLEGIHGR